MQKAPATVVIGGFATAALLTLFVLRATAAFMVRRTAHDLAALPHQPTILSL